MRMAINLKRITLLAAIAALALHPLVSQVPGLVSYQGKLLNASGQPVPNGTYSMTFRLYDAQNAGNLLLTDGHASVSTSDGIYSVELGSGTLVAGTESTLAGVFKNNADVWLSTQVGGDAEMVPRTRVTSAAYAINADAVDGLSAAQLVQASSPCTLNRFVGVTTATAAGDAGLKGMGDMCQAEFGTLFPEVRICLSEEIFRTPTSSWPILTGVSTGFWVHPSFQFAVSQNTTDQPRLILEFTGEVGDYKSLTCGNWFNTVSPYQGLALTTSGHVSARACDTDRGVTCCSP